MLNTIEPNALAHALVAAVALKEALKKHLGPPPSQPKKVKDDGTPPIRHVG